jgi:hypothetical protein
LTRFEPAGLYNDRSLTDLASILPASSSLRAGGSLFGSRLGTADQAHRPVGRRPADAPNERRCHPGRARRRCSCDAVVMTRPAFDLRANVVNSLPETALREGRLLYGA